MINDEKTKKIPITDIISKKKINFLPIWQPKEEQNVDGLVEGSTNEKEMECAFVELSMEESDGQKRKLKFNYLDLYSFIYFIGDEELRRQLALRYERKIVYMPYEVTFKIDEEEKKAGFAKRRIELPIDEVAMAMVRARAMTLGGESPVESESQLNYWRTHKITNIPDQVKEKYESTKEVNS